MLVTLDKIIGMAEEKNYCIPAFNVYNMETVMGVIAAAEEAHAPVIMQIYPRLFVEGSGYYLAPVVRAAAGVPALRPRPLRERNAAGIARGRDRYYVGRLRPPV